MPTIIKENGYRYFFYVNDHPPPHIHIEKAGNTAKVELSVLLFVNNRGFKPKELKHIRDTISQNKHILLEKWHEHFGY